MLPFLSSDLVLVLALGFPFGPVLCFLLLLETLFDLLIYFFLQSVRVSWLAIRIRLCIILLPEYLKDAV